MNITVIGVHGQVVSALRERGTALGVAVTPIGRPELDLADACSVETALTGACGDIIVNAAAYTAVDRAETEQEICARINGAGAGSVAVVAAAQRVPIIHLSTDYVFDGTLDRPYREDDATAPAGAYGRSKLLGEEAVAAAGSHHVILRTSWVYSPFGHNFLKTMLRLGESRASLNVVADQIGCPTSAFDIANGVLSIAAQLRGEPHNASLFGVFHLVGAGEATWADFAEAIFERAAEKGRPPVTVNRISTADYPTPAKRPANSRLDTRKLTQTYGLKLPDWRTSVNACVDRLLQAT